MQGSPVHGPTPVTPPAPSATDIGQTNHEALHDQGVKAFQARDFQGAMALFLEAAKLSPGNPVYFLSLARSFAAGKLFSQAATAYLRAKELAPLEPIILVELAQVLRMLDRKDDTIAVLQLAVDLYRRREAALATKNAAPVAVTAALGVPVSAGGLSLNGLEFAAISLRADANGATLLGTSADGTAFLKLELRQNPLKKNTLDGERRILEELNRQSCVTCPRLLAHGTVERAQLEACLNATGREALISSQGEAFDYLIEEFLPATEIPSLGDILLAVLEQKALGVFHADLRPENCRMDKATGLCRLIDYDQAEPLNESTRKLGNAAFFDWCTRLIQQKYSRWNFKHFLHYFPALDLKRDFEGLFREGAFNLASTRLFTNQITTAARAAIYHTIREADVFIDGERSLDSRRGYLDLIEFAPGERVLDVGCSSGIVSTYVARRGCTVTGIDLDPKIIRGCNILSHILGTDATFRYHDLDAGPIPGTFDTVLLFSVIHHTKNLRANAAAISQQCRRIIIECRLNEGGMKPTGTGGWQNTSGWNYSTLPELIAGMEALFPGFKLARNHGQGDRDRYMLELVKTDLSPAGQSLA